MAATVVVVAIKVAAGIAAELRRTTSGERTLPCPWDLEVKAVLAIHIIAYVCDLNNHALARQLRVSTAPIAIAVDLISELELKALATILIPSQAMAAAHSGRCESHAEAVRDNEGLIVRARGRRAPMANRRHIRVKQHIACVGIT